MDHLYSEVVKKNKIEKLPSKEVISSSVSSNKQISESSTPSSAMEEGGEIQFVSQLFEAIGNKLEELSRLMKYLQDALQTGANVDSILETRLQQLQLKDTNSNSEPSAIESKQTQEEAQFTLTYEQEQILENIASVIDDGYYAGKGSNSPSKTQCKVKRQIENMVLLLTQQGPSQEQIRLEVKNRIYQIELDIYGFDDANLSDKARQQLEKTVQEKMRRFWPYSI